MRNGIVAAGLSLALALSLGMGMTACSSGGESPSSGSTQALPPVMMEPDALSGADVELSMTDTLVITVPDDDPSGWTGSAEDTSVARFTPGTSDDSASFNPGFLPVAEGTTQASVTDPAGTVYEFTITVK